MAWLDEEDLVNWVEVVNHDGDFLGWIKHRDATHLKIPLNLVEIPPLWKDHPTLIHHSKLTYEMGLLKSRGEEGLSEVQALLLGSYLIRNMELDNKRHIQNFEESLLVNNPSGYKAYKDNKEQADPMDVDGVTVQERVPENIEEFLATLAAFTVEEEEEDFDSQESGWLDSILSDDEIEGMGD